MPVRKRIVRAIEIGLLLLIVLLYFSYPLIYAYQASRPAPSGLGDYLPKQFGQPYEDVNLTTQDRAVLSGWYIPSRNRAAVILLHGYGSNRTNMFAHAEILSRHGFGVLLYDMRASGLSGGTVRSYGWQDLDDVSAAIDHLKSRPEIDPQRIGIAGISTGAEVALGATIRYSDLRAALADGAGFPVQADIPSATTLEDYLMKPITPLMFSALQFFSRVRPPQPVSQHIQEIAPRPLLVISAGTGLEKRQAEWYASLSGSPTTHWNLPDSQHGWGVYTHTQEYETRMVAFFEQALLGNAP